MTAHEEAVQRHARVLKAMIWGMGVLMAAAAVVVVAMIVKAVNRPEMGEIVAGLPVPAGCNVAEMTTSGDRLIVSLGGGGPECRGILIADMRTGKLIGQFKLSGQ
jgi:hypothetical protein